MSKYLVIQPVVHVPVPDDFQLKPVHIGGAIKVTFDYQGKTINGLIQSAQITVKDTEKTRKRKT